MKESVNGSVLKPLMLGINNCLFNYKDVDGYADYYTLQGVKLAVDRFYLLSSMWINSPETLTADDGEKVSLTAVDMDGNIFRPLYIEVSPDGEKARFYRPAPSIWYGY